MKTAHIRHGIGTIRPYLYGQVDLPEFVQYVFGAEELERHQTGDNAFHVESRIGDAVLVMEAGDLPPDAKPTIASIYVYVEDIDAAYARALERGASSISAPEDKHYQERSAGITDPSGNTWWISSYTG